MEVTHDFPSLHSFEVYGLSAGTEIRSISTAPDRQGAASVSAADEFIGSVSHYPNIEVTALPSGKRAETRSSGTPAAVMTVLKNAVSVSWAEMSGACVLPVTLLMLLACSRLFR